MRRKDGLTLVELLIASAVSVLILALLVPIVMGGRRLYTLDQSRTGINQDIQAAMAMIGDDLRQAGQGLLYAGAGYNSSPRPIWVTAGTPGDSLEVWFARSGSNIPTPIGLCGNATASSIPVASSSNSCGQGDGNSNNIPDVAEPFNNYRIAQGGSVQVYLYNPSLRTGKLINLTAGSGTATNYSFTYTGSTSGTYGQGSSLMLVDRRQYTLSAGQLLLSENGGPGRAVMVGVTQFRVEPLTPTGSLWNATMPLSDLSRVRITITATDPQGVTRTQTNEFFPRNFLSQ
ncbi:PilW family protein [Meiothermus sp.]|uniref:PilW family protein n=1 Tax=Meiothermus sp. TaxID=1955249 RepID=UPI002605992D|nr:prepilin-type N-terminal cleavage/methylation domain-containing protein [Meiothermus sp.]